MQPQRQRCARRAIGKAGKFARRSATKPPAEKHPAPEQYSQLRLVVASAEAAVAALVVAVVDEALVAVAELVVPSMEKPSAGNKNMRLFCVALSLLHSLS
jgi:hypothetical protein